MITNFSESLQKALANDNIKEYNPTEIQILEELGSGSFGKVHKGLIKDINQFVAIKFLDQIDDKNNEGKGEETVKSILNELKTMTAVKNEKIPKFYGVYQQQINNSTNIGLIFSFIEGITMDKWLLKNQIIVKDQNNVDKIIINIRNSEKCQIAIQLVEIIVVLHDGKVTHRDIKPGNIMIRPDGQLVLLDFGISKMQEKTMAFTNGVKCTPRYSPPEAFDDCGESFVEYGITTKFDVWSMGCLIIEIFTGVAPWSKKFNDANKIMMAMMRKIVYNNYDFPYHKEFEKDFPELFEVVKHCLVRDIKQRYTSKQLLEQLIKLEKVYKDRNE